MATLQPIRLTALGSSAAISLPRFSNNTTIGLQLVVSGTGTYKVEYSMLDPNLNPGGIPNSPNYERYRYLFPTGDYSTDAPWLNHPFLNGISATTASNIVIPVAAIRLTCTAYTSGSGTLLMIPGSYP